MLLSIICNEREEREEKRGRKQMGELMGQIMGALRRKRKRAVS